MTTSTLLRAWRVVDSCKTKEHLWVARKYYVLAIKREANGENDRHTLLASFDNHWNKKAEEVWLNYY